MKPITNKEWKRIVEQTSRTDLPEPPFSQRYRARRLELERMVTTKEDRKFTFQPGLALATVAALAIAAIPAGMIWKMSRNQIIQSQTPDIEETGIAPGTAVEVTEPASGLIDNSIKTFEFGWLPEVMYLHGENSAYPGLICTDEKDEKSDAWRSISTDFIRLPENADFEAYCQKLQVIMNPTEPDSWTYSTQSDGDNCIWLESKDPRVHQVWVAFHDTQYVMHLYMLGLTEEETNQVVEGLRLVPADVESAILLNDPNEIEFSLDTEIHPSEANAMDMPWKGKVIQETEIGGLKILATNAASALIKTQIYPALAIQYYKDEVQTDHPVYGTAKAEDAKLIDLMYTSAPAEEIQWSNDNDGYNDILDFETFRVCVLAWNCTDEEINTVTEAVEAAAAYPLDVSKSFSVNSHGETYGCAGPHMNRITYDQLPDLIAFGGGSDVEGYVRKTELFETLGDDPDDARNHLMQDFNKTDTAVEAASLNVYDKEGEQVLHVIKYYKEQ